MFLLPFNSRFSDIAEKETKGIIIYKDDILPEGHYILKEFYCPDPKCDCRGVKIQVLHFESNAKCVATFDYGWDTVEYYIKMLHGDRQSAKERASLSIDPFGEQSKYTDRLFESVEKTLKDKDYLERLKKHYAMMKIKGN